MGYGAAAERVNTAQRRAFLWSFECKLEARMLKCLPASFAYRIAAPKSAFTVDAAFS